MALNDFAVWALTSAIAILAVIGIRALFRGSLPHAWRYALWGFVLLRLLIPGMPFHGPWSVAGAIRQAGRTETGEIAAFVVTEYELPRMSYNRAYDEVVSERMAAGDDFAALDDSELRSDAMTRMRSGVTAEDMLRILWLAGLSVTALAFLFLNLRFYLRVYAGRRRVAADCALKVWAVEGLTSSCLFGRSIYVPPETAEDPERLRHVLAHENSHYRHGDALWALLRCAALALHWYNPLVWWAAALSRQDAELCADAGAVRALGEDQREAYGATLIALSARSKVRAPLLCAATTMWGGKRALKERVVSIARGKLRMTALLAFDVFFLLGIALALTFTGAEAAEPEFYPAAAVIWNPYPYDSSADVTDERELAALWAIYQEALETGAEADTPQGSLSYPSYLVRFPEGEPEHPRGFEVCESMLRAWDGETYFVLDRNAVKDVYCGEVASIFAAVSGAVPATDSDLSVAPENAARTVPYPRVEAELGDGFPQAPLDWAVELAYRDALFYEQVSEEYDLGYHVTDVKLTGLTRVDNTTANLQYAISMYRMEWRILVDRPERVVLAGGMRMEDGWITEQGSTGRRYIILARLKDDIDVRWERICPMNDDSIRFDYATPELLERYGDPYTAVCVEKFNEWVSDRAALAEFAADIPAFLNDVNTAFSIDSDGAFALLRELAAYVREHELTDGQFSAALRCTGHLDGAYAEAYQQIFNTLYAREPGRYLRLWSMLPEEERSAALPEAAFEATGFAGWEAAAVWMEQQSLPPQSAPANIE